MNILGVEMKDSRTTEVTPDKKRNFRMWLAVRRCENRFVPVFHRKKK